MRIFGKKGTGEATEAPSAETGLPGVLADAALYIDEVVASSERASSAIRASLEQQRTGRGRIAPSPRDSVIEQLAESLVARMDELRDSSEELSRILARAASGLQTGTPTAAAPGQASPPAAPPGQSPPSPAQARPPASPLRVEKHPVNGRRRGLGAAVAERRGGVSEGMRLLVTQMSVAGSSKHEIEARLQRDFGVEDADDLLAEVLGPTG